MVRTFPGESFSEPGRKTWTRLHRPARRSSGFDQTPAQKTGQPFMLKTDRTPLFGPGMSENSSRALRVYPPPPQQISTNPALKTAAGKPLNLLEFGGKKPQTLAAQAASTPPQVVADNYADSAHNRRVNQKRAETGEAIMTGATELPSAQHPEEYSSAPPKLCRQPRRRKTGKLHRVPPSPPFATS